MRIDNINATIDAAREERGRLMREAICRGWNHLVRGLHIGPNDHASRTSRRPGGHARPSAQH